MTYPPGYPLAPGGPAQTSRNGSGSRATSGTKDSPSSLSSSRLSARKLDAISSRLSARDYEVTSLVGRFRVMSGAQLQRLFWPEGAPSTRARLARHALSRLVRLGVLAPLGRTVGGVRAGSRGRCFALGIAGQRLMTAGYPKRQARYPYTPGARYLAHTLAVAGLYVGLVEAERRKSMEVLAFDPEPACWRPYLGSWGARLTLKPDVFLKIGIGEFAYSWFVEQDMATESLATIERKAQRHLAYHQSGSELRACGVAPRVAWITTDEARADAIRKVLAGLPVEAKRLFAVTQTSEAQKLLATGVWS